MGSSSGTFALVNFANKTSVTVDGAGGGDTFALDVTTPAAGLTALILKEDSSAATYTVTTTPPGSR